MEPPTQKTSTQDETAESKTPGEVRSPIQAFVRVALALVVVLLIGGALWALFLRV